LDRAVTPNDGQTHDLRASDADREATAERLQTAALEGRLDPTELDQRMSQAYAARWCSELKELTADVTPPPAPPAPAPAPPAFVRAAPVNGFAVASLVAGIVWMFWLGSALAIVFGHVALSQIKAEQGGQGGRGIAIAGLALGYFGALTFGLVLLAALADA
jgi:Domain of unknown function (DUF1707)/Domain of unknown function (DUF4190)